MTHHPLQPRIPADRADRVHPLSALLPEWAWLTDFWSAGVYLVHPGGLHVYVPQNELVPFPRKETSWEALAGVLTAAAKERTGWASLRVEAGAWKVS